MEHKEEIDKFVKKWVEIGLSTTRANRSKAESLVETMYENIGLEKPEIQWFESPAAMYRAAMLKLNNIDGELEFDKELKKPDLDHIAYGTFDAAYMAYYDYFLSIGVKAVERMKPLIDLSKEIGWWMPYDTIVFISEKPTGIHIKDGRLHKDGAAAIEYSDGRSALYALNGVRVPKEIAVTPFDELSSDRLLKEQNVEVRREILRKMGAEQFLKKSKAKELDKHTVKDPQKMTYELYECPIGSNGDKAHFLKMPNQSLPDVYHVECVPVACSTVEEALAWRNGTKESPEQLT